LKGCTSARGGFAAQALARGVAAALAIVPVTALHAQALPFLPAGDARLRHEVQLAVDAGRMPLATTWPLPTRDIPEAEREQLRSRLQPGSGEDAGWFVSGAAHPTDLRTYAATPRENGEAGLHAGWAAEDYAGGAFRVSYSVDPEDDRHLRLDGTYASWRVGNWWGTVGSQERWWGPGHEGSLILSNNARPMLQVSVDRAEARAPEWRWLRWIGPYRWSTFMGKFEKGNSGYPNPLLWGLRGSFRPFDAGLEIGLSRTAQWCRPGICDLQAFGDVVLGRDNRGENVDAEDEPGNQLAGFDIRWALPIGVPLAAYWQLNGESIDNRNWRPRRQTQLMGFETWSVPDADGSSWRAFVEFTDTACGAIGFRPGNEASFGCAYENEAFPEGYRRRDRVIGHSMEADARLYTLGGLYARADGRTLEWRVRYAELNRGAVDFPRPTNTVTPFALDLWNVELRLTGRWHGFDVGVGIGADYREPVDRDSSTVGRAFLQIQKPW
jgi:hypothetical protein